MIRERIYKTGPLVGSTVTILQEPKDDTYQQLLAYAVGTGGVCSLVWRHEQHDESARQIEEALRPALIDEAEADKWPGTRLYGMTATVRFYKVDDAARAVLAKARALFSWLAPDRPEDLAFYGTDGRPWLGSIAHERDAFLYLDAVDVDAVVAAVPGLVLGSVAMDVEPGSN